MLGNIFMLLLLSADFFFSKFTFFKNFFQEHYQFRNTIGVPNNLEPDQDRHSVGPDLDPNCLQRFLSADDKVAAIKQGQS